MKKLRPSGGYRDTCSFQTATLIYDSTVWFCEKFVDPRSRLVDQMVQAARSGRQNIAEGSRASATSSQTELRLLNVARASLEELLLDYEDFLRHRRLPQWGPDSPQARAVRRVPQEFRKKQSDLSDPTDLTDISDHQRWGLYAPWLDNADPAVRANTLICLIHQTNFLLDRQIGALEKQFVEGGGYSEQLATARLAHRAGKGKNLPDPTDRSDPADLIPSCPQCGGPMALRTAKTGKNAGQQFWGCTTDHLMRILLIEDEADLLASLGKALREEGYAVDTAADGEEGLYKAREVAYDAVVLDVMLPRMDGWEVLGRLRESKRTPVLMLTARDAARDRVRGLDTGADDYLVKPFDLEELFARLRAIIRRAAGQTRNIIEIGGAVVDTAARRVTLSGNPVELTAREYCLLEFLALHRGETVTRTALYEHLFDEDDDSLSNLLDVHVSNLRKKLGHGLIETRRGHGYCIG